MNKSWIAVLGVILLVAGAAGLAVTATYQPRSRDTGSFPGRGVDTGTLPLTANDAIDAMFIEQMIPHHEDAVDMADLALESAEHPELRALAREIKRTQTAEIEQMREWYREWFDEEVPEYSGRGPGRMGGMRGGMMGRMGTDLDALEDADPFDREFIEQMVPHHQMALMMAGMLEQGTNRSEMRAFAREIIDTQGREIEQMQEWYQEWYGR